MPSDKDGFIISLILAIRPSCGKVRAASVVSDDACVASQNISNGSDNRYV